LKDWIRGGHRRPKQRSNNRAGAPTEAFLLDMLANGPVPATLVEARGAAHGFSRKQLRYAREQMNIVAFKEVGRLNGRWFWRLGG
jgi:hypothetical protein